MPIWDPELDHHVSLLENMLISGRGRDAIQSHVLDCGRKPDTD